MTIRLLRSAALAGLLIVSVLACTSCDALNPAFVSQIGGSSGAAGPEPTGSIVLVFNNQRAQRFALSYDLTINRAGEQTVTASGGALEAETGYWTATFDCNTTAITLRGVVPISSSSATQPASQPSTGTSLGLDGVEFSRPALQCGSVLFVNLPLVGSPTVDLFP